MTHSDKMSKRVWPILLIGLGIFIACGITAFLSKGIVVSKLYGVDFPPSQELIDQWTQDHFATASGFSKTMIPIHIVMALLVIIAAVLSRQPAIDRMGLNKNAFPNWSYPSGVPVSMAYIQIILCDTTPGSSMHSTLCPTLYST